MGLLRHRKRTDRPGAIERTLEAVTEAVNIAGDEQAQRHAELLTALHSLSERVDNLASAVQVVMAARREGPAQAGPAAAPPAGNQRGDGRHS